MNTSFVSMEAELLRNWCLRVVQRIQSCRNKNRADIIQENNKWSNKWRRRFFMQPVDLQATKASLENDRSTIFSEYHMVDCQYGYALEIAQNLLAATEVTNRVNVTVEHIGVLRSWVE